MVTEIAIGKHTGRNRWRSYLKFVKVQVVYYHHHHTTTLPPSPLPLSIITKTVAKSINKKQTKKYHK